MIRLFGFIFSFIMVMLRLLRPGGARAIAAENVALRKQLISVSRHQKRAPNLTTIDRLIFGFLASMINDYHAFVLPLNLQPY